VLGGGTPGVPEVWGEGAGEVALSPELFKEVKVFPGEGELPGALAAGGSRGRVLERLRQKKESHAGSARQGGASQGLGLCPTWTQALVIGPNLPPC